MEEVDREISEMKLSLNARARIVAESYLTAVRSLRVLSPSFTDYLTYTVQFIILLKTIGFSCVCISVIRFESCLLARTGNNAQWMCRLQKSLSNNNQACIEYKIVNPSCQIIRRCRRRPTPDVCHLQIKMNNVRHLDLHHV
jgi:ARP2/3 complex 20 kDa subunit (ARPC4)